MNVVRKIEITEEQAKWLDNEIASGNIASESDLLEEIITERRFQKLESTPEGRAWLEAELQKGIDSGISDKSVDEIWEEVHEIINRN